MKSRDRYIEACFAQWALHANAPRGRRASFATLQSPFYPAIPATSQLSTGLVLLGHSGLVLLWP
jgi:hypothetical protein